MAAGICIPTFPADLDRDHFGHWLSGFCDGEACFKLRRLTERSKNPVAQLNITLRADDYDTLALMRSFWRCGTLHYFTNQRCRTKNAKPVWIYGIQDVPSLVNIIIPHFARYPLRAKKRNDFVIWAEAVRLMHEVQQRPAQYNRLINRYHGQARRWTDQDVQQFTALTNALAAQRVFTEPEITNPPT